MKRKIPSKLLFKWTVLIGITGLLVRCSNAPSDEPSIEEVQTELKLSFIQPPLPGVNVPYRTYTLDVSEGGEFSFPSGTSVHFPPNALIDKDGRVVTGEVNVLMREFVDPIDFYFAGIPMTYDSAGASYTFVSSGMFEIEAEQNGVSLMVNPEAQPEVKLTSESRTNGENLYFLDTTRQNWVFRNELLKQVEIQNEPTREKVVSSFNNEPDLIPPPKPRKADGIRPTISVELDFDRVIPEYAIFNQTMFEVDESDSTYDPKDGDEAWTAIDLKRTKTKGVYRLMFSNLRRKVAYRVRPVYEGKAFEKAMIVYEDLMDEFEKLRQARKDRIRRDEERMKQYPKDKSREMEVINLFTLSGFGIWNCDRPLEVLNTRVYADFVDENNQYLELPSFSMVIQNINAIFWHNEPFINITPDTPFAVWTIYNNQFIYFKYSDFQNIAFDMKAKTITLKMHVYPKEIKSIDEVRAVLEI